MSMTTNPRQSQNSVFGKPPTQSTGIQQQKRRPGGGWEEANDEPRLKNVGNTYGENKANQDNNQSPLNREAGSPSVSQPNKKNLSTPQLQVFECDESFLTSHEYESKIINEIIQPGGARVKQPDSALLEFCNKCEHLEPSTIGSILLSKFNEQIGWIPKARVIFAVEALSKKFNRYFDYFKHNLDVLKKVSFTPEGLNANQLRKFMDSLMHILNHPAFSAELQKENQLFTQAPTLPHNNSQGEPSKTKTEQKAGPLSAVKSSSLPSSSANQEKPNLNFVNLKTVKDSGQKTMPKNQNADLLDTVSPVHQNVMTTPKIPFDQTNDIANSLAGIDFSSDNVKSPNNLLDLYKAPSPINNYYGATSPIGFPGGYSPAYSPAYYNYPVSNNQVQGGFNSYVQANSGGYQNNNNFGQYGNNDIFNQPTEVDKEEIEKQKKREQIEKQFESLSWK